jgi:hypothetical protein
VTRRTGTSLAGRTLGHRPDAPGETTMRSLLLYVLGIPLPIILIIALFTHHF